jgi:hypothetical protein
MSDYQLGRRTVLLICRVGLHCHISELPPNQSISLETMKGHDDQSQNLVFSHFSLDRQLDETYHEEQAHLPG